MAATFGYGKKTFIQGLARLSCRMAKYIAKYQPTLNKYLSGAALACISSMITCLNTLCGLINKSSR